jgi:hypothetical protein
LEARWAIFFRELGLKWKYEPAVLHGARCSYTPDFVVEEFGYVEIKPTVELFIEESSERVCKIAAANPELSFYVFCGGEVQLVWGVALYRGDKIFAPTARQLCFFLARARGCERLPLETVQNGYINRAINVANAKKFSNEWQSASEVLPDVLKELEQKTVR